MKRAIYRNTKGRFVSPSRYFKAGKKAHPHWKKQFIEYPEKPKIHAPEFKIGRGYRKLVSRGLLSSHINQKLKSLIPFDGIFEGPEFEVSKIKEYSLVGRYVLYDVEKKLKGVPIYLRGHPKRKSQQRQIRGVVYTARIKAYMEILGVQKKQAQALYRIIEDKTHPQHLEIMEKIYGKRSVYGISRSRLRNDQREKQIALSKLRKNAKDKKRKGRTRIL